MRRIPGCSVVVTTLAAIVASAAPVAQGQPALRRGPALAHGYEYALASRFGLFLTDEREVLANGVERHDSAVELAGDWRATPTWLLSVRWPLRLTMDGWDPTTHGLSPGNLGIVATYVHETRYSAEQFVGLLFPVVSVGVVTPLGIRSRRSAETLAVFTDAAPLYLEDTAALTLATHARFDFFMFHGLFLQTGPELQLLDGGETLATFGLGGGFGRNRNEGLDVRLVGEYQWTREIGQPEEARVIAGGKRSLCRVGLYLGQPSDVGAPAWGASVSATLPLGDTPARVYPTLEVHRAF